MRGCLCLRVVLLLPMLMLMPSATTTTAAAFVIQSPSSSCNSAATATAVEIHNPIIAPNGGSSISSRIAGSGVPSMTVLTRMNANNNKNDENNNGGDNDDSNILLDVPIFALKLAVVLTVKVVKDLVNYPPMLFEQVLQQQRRHQKLNAGSSNSNSDGIIINSNSNSNNINSVDQQMSPLVMLAKFCGVLVFKGVHDAFYFPMIWTQDIATDVERAALTFRSSYSSGRLLESEYRYRYGAPPPEVAATMYLASLWIENLCGMVRDNYHSNDLFFH